MTFMINPPPPPPPPPPDEQQQEEEAQLSFVSLSFNNRAVMLNDEPYYPVKLPTSLLVNNKSYEERLKIVKDVIFEGCSLYKVDQLSEDNVTRCAKQVIQIIDERERAREKEEQEKEEEEEEQKQQQQKENEGDEDEEVLDEQNEEDDSDDRAIKALKLAKKHCEEIFVNEFSRPFAAMRMPDGHTEVHPMDESKFKNWIQGLYHTTYDKLLSREALDKIVTILRYQADFDGSIPRHSLDVRVRGYNSKTKKGLDGGDGDDDQNDMAVGNVGYVGIYAEIMEDFDTIYYDLTNKKWQAIKITANGWEIDNHPPFLFRRYGGEIPQMRPNRKYEPEVFNEWISLMNLKPENRESQELLLKVKEVSEFWPTTATAKPIITLPSSQGSGKTTAFELERDLIDPNMALTMSLPKDDNQLKQLLAHNYLVRFDNLSHLTDDQSNILCRSVTGAGDFKRALYENDEDIIYKYKRSVGLNGITNVATRPDLSERGLFFEFAEIPRTNRELLRVIWRKHLQLKPKVLAFCLDVISEVMAERQKWKDTDPDYFGLKDTIKQNGGLPRMADWAILGEQIAAIIAKKEGHQYKPSTFLKAFDKNQELLNIEAIKSSLVAEALIALMYNRAITEKKTTWEGSATMLLAELNQFILYNSDSVKINTKTRAWPQDPAKLGSDLAKIRPNLRALGVAIGSKRTEQNVQYFIEKLPTGPTLPTAVDKDGKSSKEGENPEKSTPVGHVGAVGKTPKKFTDLLFEQLVNRLPKDKDYFTEDDWEYQCTIWPNLDWDRKHAKEALNQLLLECKIRELEPGKYQTTQKLSTRGGP